MTTDAAPETLEALGYRPLFDGDTLDGWRNPFDHGSAEVGDGDIRLRGNQKFFLVTERAYSDFRLVVDIHLPEGPANSGVMFRCHAEPNRVYGYQAECDGSDRRWSGGLYDEGRRQWVWPSIKGRSEPEFLAHEAHSQAAFRAPEIRDALRRDGWNRYEVECRGDRITIWLNGVQTTQVRDSMDSSGYIGIQHHGEKGQVYRFRNLYLKELPEVPAADTVSLVEEAPVACRSVGDGVTLVDFGRVAFGNLKLSPRAKLGGPIEFHFGEALRDGRVDRTPPGTVRYSSAALAEAPAAPRVVAPAADERNTQQATPGTPPAVITPAEWSVVTPFRWVEVKGISPADLDGTIVRRAAYASDWSDDAASFECSDPTLNRVADLCRYSIKATTFAGVYVDGDRERIPYEADAYINQLGHFYAEGDHRMARRTFDWLLEYPTWPTEWAPHVVFMAHADYRHTGDTEWLAPRYEALRTKTLSERIGPTGFVHSNAAQRGRDDIIDWPQKERDGFVFAEVNSVVNAFHVAAVRQLAELADAVGARDDAAAYRQRLEKMIPLFHETFFDAEVGLYRDGAGVDHHSLHANLFPLAFGLVPAEHRRGVADWLAVRGMACSVYSAQYLLEGMFREGDSAAALALITAPGRRSWRHMLDSDATITWEAWDVAFKPNLDWNHAWGAAPANLLPRFVLGVEAATPGWGRVAVDPRPGDLSFARGKVPTRHGPVTVGWTREGDSFSMSLTLPDGCSAAVSLPALAGAEGVTVDGQPADADLVAGRLRLREELTGKHTIALR